MIVITLLKVRLILTGKILRFKQFLKICLLGNVVVMEPLLSELAAVIFKNFKIADSGIAGIEFSMIEDVADGYAKVDGGIVVGNTGLNDEGGLIG